MTTHKVGPTKGEALVVVALAFVAGLDVAAFAALVQAASQVG